jgi:phage tail-like protein
VQVDADVPAGTALSIAVATAEYAPLAIMPAPQGATQDGDVVTVTTSAPHGRRPGDVVRIEGVGVAAYNQATVPIKSVPTSTSLTYTLAAAGLAASGDGTVAPPPQGDSTRDPVWSSFPAGQAHFKDWTGGPAGSLDFVIDQPPGRYLFFRLRFTGNGADTPVVRRVRIDFPRVTSLEQMPAVYRENPKAEDFTERFLALFDASIAATDRVVERYPALLDAAGVPEQLLPWLGSFFDIGFDSTWDADKRRAILQGAPELYRQRGTIAGLQLALKLVFGVSPAIEEIASTGTWGALGSRKALQAARCKASGTQAMLHRNARVGTVRLFSKARSRFRLNSSPLCAAPLRSYGNPDLDPFAAGAYRFRLLLPPLADNSEQQRQRLMSLVEAQKPAHTVASLRVGGAGFILGRWSAVGIDTAFVPPGAPVLGSAGNVRLNRMSILWNGPRGREIATAVGSNSVVGIQTIAG